MRSLSLQRLLVTAADNLGVRFQSGGKPVPAILVFGADSFMPAVALIAESSAQDLMGWTLGAKFSLSERSVFGVSVDTMPVQGRLIEGTVLGLMYLRAAAECFGWAREPMVDLHRVYADVSPAMARLVTLQRAPREGVIS